MAAVCLLGIDGLWIEPNSIQVTHWNVEDRLHPPLRIAHLSDLHVIRFGWRERRVIAILRSERPDLIVITGDSVGEGLHYQAVHDVLSAIVGTRPPLGVWLVRGNWENWHPLRHERQFYESAGVHFLLNSGALIRPGLWLAGLDDPWSGHGDPGRALAGAPSGAYVIVLFHSPAYFDDIAGQFDLALTGHTHGGQVRLPLVGPFWLPGGSGRFLSGWYDERGSRMYVSRGVGWSHIPIRLNCPPEIPIITVGE
ncbi:MAG TPA: metallophosphoesterase [Candidatus Acidoferrales bacterium]|nr:metallophosphoesterase [Candidatus Acidoferrales bacterium]